MWRTQGLFEDNSFLTVSKLCLLAQPRRSHGMDTAPTTHLPAPGLRTSVTWLLQGLEMPQHWGRGLAGPFQNICKCWNPWLQVSHSSRNSKTTWQAELLPPHYRIQRLSHRAGPSQRPASPWVICSCSGWRAAAGCPGPWTLSWIYSSRWGWLGTCHCHHCRTLCSHMERRNSWRVGMILGEEQQSGHHEYSGSTVGACGSACV